jgi:5-formyltetrahydrofolate cyclo-ligase
LTALPVVVAPKQPLVFREWHPGVELAPGPLDIPYPANSPAVVPNAVLLPMNGWDPSGYLLGSRGGFFDRTLASREKRRHRRDLRAAKMETIHPQTWDIPVDWVVTERGVYRRDGDKWSFSANPGGRAEQARLPVCYADEIAPGYFGLKLSEA